MESSNLPGLGRLSSDGSRTDSLTFGSLCSGIGGKDLGLERAGLRCIWQVEIEPYCRHVLATHWPDVPRYEDIKTTDWSTLDRPDVIAAGYPCQPFSSAGKRRGRDDPRHLWPFVADAIRVLRPRYVVLENVAGHLSLGFDVVLADLHALGFDAEWSLVSACSVGAPHARQRLFVLAYPQGDDGAGQVPRNPWSDTAGSDELGGGRRREGRDGWLPEPSVDRVAHGLPRAVVRPPLEGLGNAVVPAVAELVGRRLMAMVA